MKPSPDDVLSGLTRPVFCASPGKSLLIVDYASIEARVLAWLAGQEDMLRIFRDDGDVYLDMATAIYGRTVTAKDETERQVGKVVVLGAGYGLSGRRCGAYCALQRVDLQAAGTSGEECIAAYRAKYPRIPALWREYDRATKCAIERGPTDAGRCHFAYDGGTLTIVLPSGRPLYYRGASLQPRVPAYCKLLGLPEDPKPTVVYAKRPGLEGTLYGGLITENIDQAVSRDIMATALVRVEAARLDPVLHVHDEIVAETDPGRLEEMCRLMVDTPEWARGLPLAVEGYPCSHYSKSPFAGTKKIKIRA